jgi:hypothetical protein
LLGVWLRQRWEVFSWLIDTHSLHECLPVHVGVEGIPAYLDELRIRQGSDARDDFLYTLFQHVDRLPWYRHWLYALLLPMVMFFSWRSTSLDQARNVILLEGAALTAYLISFFPTSIACDFRYLYPIIPSLSGVLLVLLLWPRLLVADAKATPE